MAYKCILFDMDGTLVDSVHFHTLALQRFFQLYHAQSYPYQRLRSIMRRNFSEIFDALGIDPALCDSYYHEKLPLFYEGQADDLIAAHIVPNGDVLGTLQALHQKGVRLGLISNSKHELVAHTARILGLTPYLEVVSGADNTYIDKLERCRIAVADMRLDPGDVLYVGDSERDVEVSNELGFDSCYLRTPISWAADDEYIIHTLKPTMILGDIRDLNALKKRQRV